MRFSESEIEWATRLRGAGLEWDPQPGHYVFDINGLMKAGSPFQAGVYVISSLNALATAAGSEETVREAFAWLPTWENARAWLVERGVSAEQLAAALLQGLNDGVSDRECLYRLMLEILEDSPSKAASA